MSLLPVEEALARLLADVRTVPETETVPLRHLAGRIAAADLVARRTQPSFDASAMDGYAVRAGDLGVIPCELRVIGESAAGKAFAGQVDEGETVRIFTGAPMPVGADAVVIQEDTERPSDTIVRVREGLQSGRNVRRAGNDFRDGDVLVKAGTRFRAAAIALAASGGYADVPVLRRPRVAIVATGDELVPPGAAVGPSQIVASNGYAIAALVETSGGEALDYGIAIDDADVIAACLDRALADRADVLVTIGGASVGDHDLVGPVLQSRGVSLDFWRVAMRPGKPLMAGRLGDLRIVGLPGNPASSIVTSELFLVPLVEKLAGRGDRDRYRRGRLGADLPANDHRAEFMRSRLVHGSDGEVTVMPFDRQDSSLLSIFAEADALLYREPNALPASAGDECRFLLLD